MKLLLTHTYIRIFYMETNYMTIFNRKIPKWIIDIAVYLGMDGKDVYKLLQGAQGTYLWM